MTRTIYITTVDGSRYHGPWYKATPEECAEWLKAERGEDDVFSRPPGVPMKRAPKGARVGSDADGIIGVYDISLIRKGCALAVVDTEYSNGADEIRAALEAA